MALKDHKRLITWKIGEQEAHYSEDKVKSFVEEIKQEVINDNTTENLEFIQKNRVLKIIDKVTGFNDSPETQVQPLPAEKQSSSGLGQGPTGEGPNIQPSPERKLNWSGVCAVSDNRNQCSEENCILFPICKIKKKKEVEK